MAEFPPNLDDGELWLPSEIFPDVGVCRHRQPVAAALRPDLSYVDDLAEKLAAFGLLDRSSLLLPAVRPNPRPSDRFLFGNGPVLRFGPAAEKNTGAGMVYDGFRPPAVPRRAASGLRPVFPFPRAKPAQVEIFGQERRGVLARQQQASKVEERSSKSSSRGSPQGVQRWGSKECHFARSLLRWGCLRTGPTEAPSSTPNPCISHCVQRKRTPYFVVLLSFEE